MTNLPRALLSYERNKNMRFALAGNPNCGKTTLFNALTGSNQHVGNWPGVTVEKKEGACKANKDFQIVDLPGIYSLSPYTLEEVVARNFIIQERPDAIINIIDGSNLERNLYLTTQILELGLPVLVAINMMDVVRKNGDTINIEALREKLGAADVIEISALKGEGIDKLVAALPGLAAKAAPTGMAFSSDIEPAVKAVTAKLPDSIDPAVRRFYAVKLLEGDEKIGEGIEGIPDISAQVKAIESATDDTAESAIINERYEWMAEKATEIGVDTIVPVIGDRSERKVFKTERLKRLVLSAAKQSLKGAVPQVEEPVSVKAFIETAPGAALKLIAYCFEGDKLSIKAALEASQAKDVVVLIGPEGDFSPSEVDAALKAGFKPVHLGDSRLRTETAAIASAMALYLKYMQ